MNSTLLLLACFACFYMAFVIIPILAVSGRKKKGQ